MRGAPSGPGSRASHEAASASSPKASIPSAGNAEPDWFEVAKALANAIMFQRGTRSEHVVGRDGRVRMGMVDLLGCYCVDDAARDFCELAGIPFESIEAPNEHQAFFMSVTGRKWSDWFTDKAAIVEGAGPQPKRGRVDMKRIASAIEARRVETQSGSVEDESAGPKDDAQERSA